MWESGGNQQEKNLNSTLGKLVLVLRRLGKAVQVEKEACEKYKDVKIWWLRVTGRRFVTYKHRTGINREVGTGEIIITASFVFYWRREWQPTPVFLPGKFHRQKSLVGCSPWSCKELDNIEHTRVDFYYYVPDSILRTLEDLSYVFFTIIIWRDIPILEMRIWRLKEIVYLLETPSC